jgi:pimeloyl-ACP methyl ester carboxylesterase
MSQAQIEKTAQAQFLGMQAYNYIVDRSQRSFLFWDAMRKRGNTYLSHLEENQPPILMFDYEEILDGRTFEHPVNYSLLNIVDRRVSESQRREDKREEGQKFKLNRRKTHHGKILSGKGRPAQPIVVIDPRAGHGPGIGGFKVSSQIGIALDYGHPVYYFSFSTDPVSGQTISDVHNAEIRFLEEVSKRHPDAPKPAVIGNCQGGWAAALIGADRPDVTGPMIFNGSPLSYWGGVEGSNPMRYKGGLTGGLWLTSLLSDLGNDTFDGANLVAGFEGLNPANTYWSKYYHLFTNIDTEEERYLDFEKWWGGFFKMNAEEIHFIVNSLFVGNELEKGHLRMDDGRLIDLKNFKSPILAFASVGDNITPPPQALNWIHKVYGTVEEIKRCEQVIIYMVHPKVGHLGIFVSGSVAQKEHNNILGSMGWMEYIGPGLYEMVIEQSSSGLDDYEVRFEERTMENLLQMDDGQEDEEPFVAVNGISRFSDAIYRSYVSPWVRAAVDEPTSELYRQLHPLRTQRYMISDNNPFCWPLKYVSETIVPLRKPADKDNVFVQWEEIFSDTVKSSFDYFRDARDFSQEVLFKSIYDTPWMRNIFGDIGKGDDEDSLSVEVRLKKEASEKAKLSEKAEEGGFVEACVRVILAITAADKILDTREFQLAEEIIQESKRLRAISPEEYQKIAREQIKILNIFPRKSLELLSKMVPEAEDRKKLLEIAERMAQADTIMHRNEEGLLKILRKTLL